MKINIELGEDDCLEKQLIAIKMIKAEQAFCCLTETLNFISRYDKHRDLSKDESILLDDIEAGFRNILDANEIYLELLEG